MTPRAYTTWIVAGCLALLAPVLALNLLLLANDSRHDKNRLASRWQQETGGVTYAPPINNNRAFKTLRLHDRLGDINALAFGSSTVMSLTADAFPGDVRVYNFAQSGNSLLSVLGEAGYVLTHWPERIRTLFIPLDWSLGFTYQSGALQPTDLAAEQVPPPGPLPVVTALREALSLPRIQELGAILRDIVRADNPRIAAQQFFVEPGSLPYRCADGLPARDFSTVHRGLCNGFRADGSATFADQKRVSAAEAPAVIARAASASSQYALALARTQGEPDAQLLQHLEAMAALARSRGVQILLFMPPLIPQLDARLEASAHSGARLRQTKAVFRQWAQQQQVPFIDGGPSERYGCLPTEFIDAHHALPDCYRKFMTQVFADRKVLP
ncbi:MAG: SGNH/GDSL hydrolase family protein [Burkholderiales bacterium]|nr:SGNH/GDSL hydrolase family protein [Burkholderiales bacterium]